MINAGIKIHSFDGNQQFNDTTNQWEGIKVTINFPSGQDSTNNAPIAGDVLIEQDGKIWEVDGVSGLSGDDFSLNLLLKTDTPSSSISPNLGLVERGSIVSPINGILTPHWDPTKVSSEVTQIAAIYNTEQGTFGNSEALTTMQTELDNKLSLTGGTVTGDLNVVGTIIETDPV